MLSSIGSVTGSSFNNTNDPTQDPFATQNPDDPTNPNNANDPANPNQQTRPVNTSSQVAALRKLEHTIAKRLKQAIATASSGSVAAQAMVGALTAQITSIQAQIDHISGLDAMRQQKHAVPASQGANGSRHAQLLKQAEKSEQAEEKHKLTTGDANDNDTTSQKLKPFRFDFTGTNVDDTA
ncbi:hypothetical protein KZJ38_32120 [Paraburkholderia edwinii]|uniref:FlxA-like protein n=1 Tax=Paraburkholderia edwinii TaxID=2861782 RepID=A0ABX8URL2_9BURK|nr:hypothetical protein [Paraburkholderia edwinii]QYD71646.1 hypothetical protein KZJ38_32120 [Paraburkholderia edwinii]